MAKQRKCTAQSVSALLRKAGFRRSEPVLVVREKGEAQ
jgi:hypothetical protein